MNRFELEADEYAARAEDDLLRRAEDAPWMEYTGPGEEGDDEDHDLSLLRLRLVALGWHVDTTQEETQRLLHLLEARGIDFMAIPSDELNELCWDLPWLDDEEA